MLERSYGVAGDDLAQQLTDVAGKLASEYWDDHQRDFRYIVDGSFLAEYDDYNIEVQFKVRCHRQYRLCPDVSLWAGYGTIFPA